MPKYLSFLSKLEWWTLSNALEKYSNIASIWFLLSILLTSHLLNLLNVFHEIYSFFLSYAGVGAVHNVYLDDLLFCCILYVKVDLKGQWFPGSDLSPFLNRGVTLVNFQSLGFLVYWCLKQDCEDWRTLII